VKQSVLIPALDTPATATAGSQIFERSNGLRYEAVKVDGSATKMTESGRQTIEAGQLLFVDTDAAKLIACLAPDEDVLCLTDKDKDGRFDVVNTWIGLFPKKLPEPISYSRGFTLLAPNAENTFKQTLTFLGMTGPTLRLSYREFINDMARPAFTEEVTFAMSGTYPETVAYKDLSIDVLGVSNSGLRYVIRKAGN
jgi:hypothetical protein